MSEIQALERAIAALENQRNQLGDSTVDAALAPLREKLHALQASPQTPAQQLKYASALFTDIVDSTRLGQNLDPEDTTEIMNGALERFKEVIEQHGGRVTRFMGDGLKAVFGIPVAAEDDAERAVRAGLALVQAAQDYARQVEETWRLSGFNIRVGINTGQILFGSGVEAENTIMGMAINLARRMESAAPVGGVLISENTHQLVRGRFELLAQPPIHVKGVEQPMQTYQVLRASPRLFHAADRGIHGVTTPLVGREEELACLQGAYQATFKAPRARLLTVLGEAGVGKSRLLEAFEAWIAQQPAKMQTYTARASRQTLTSPYSLLRELFARAFDILESDPADQARQKLENGLAPRLAEEAKMKAHFIGALLGYDYSLSPHLSGVLSDPQQISLLGLFSLVQYFANLARVNPVLILLDDIHWADKPSLEFIRRLVGELGDYPLLVICLARRLLLENHPEWQPAGTLGTAECSKLELPSLSEAHCRQLVQAILDRVEQLPEPLLEMIVQQAEGNPYYIEELINMLIDDGVILTGDDGVILTGDDGVILTGDDGVIRVGEGGASWQIDLTRLEDLRIPPTLTAVLQARLDGLPHAEKSVLQRAAVIGRTFWEQPLQVMLAAPGPPLAELESLSRRGLIHPNHISTFEGIGEYAFRQTLLREVTYETVLKRDRQRDHASVAAWLVEITQSSGRTDEHLALIAEHYNRAGDSVQAADWYLRAGERARSQGATLQARQFYNLALELLPERDRERRWRALLGRDEVLSLLGESVARQADGQALLALAQGAGDERWLAEAYYRLGTAAYTRGEEREALQAYQAAIAAARSCSEHRLIALSLGLSAISHTRLGDLESAGRCAAEALELAQQIGDDETLARVFTNIAAHYSEVGDLSRSQELLQEQIRLTNRLGYRLGEAIGYINLGYGYAQLGEYTSAQTALEEALRLAQAIGARQHHAYAQLNLGLVHRRMGSYTAAADSLEPALQTLGGIGDQFGRAAALIYLALNQEACQDFASAMQNYATARGELSLLGMPALENDAIAGLARCALALDQVEPARHHATELWAYLLKTRGRGMEFPLLAYLTCVDVFTSLQQPSQAQAALQAGRQELMSRAANISDPGWRQAYLQNVPEHAEIVARWEQTEQRETHSKNTPAT